MKLDRNLSATGEGKYALVKLRKLRELQRNPDLGKEAYEAESAISTLVRYGLIHWGSEGPGEQFFVMKYKDRFTHSALKAYAQAVDAEAAKTCNTDLSEYAAEIDGEAIAAQRHGKRTPD